MVHFILILGHLDEIFIENSWVISIKCPEYYLVPIWRKLYN